MTFEHRLKGRERAMQISEGKAFQAGGKAKVKKKKKTFGTLQGNREMFKVTNNSKTGITNMMYLGGTEGFSEIMTIAIGKNKKHVKDMT